MTRPRVDQSVRRRTASWFVQKASQKKCQWQRMLYMQIH